MDELIVKNNKEELITINNFIKDKLTNYKFIDINYKLELEIAIEEIFINIVNHGHDTNEITIRLAIKENPLTFIISFIDTGSKYNPLEKEDPDITLEMEDRSLGGLGIFLMKKNTDNISYDYKNNKNILTIWKILEDQHE
ncbi:ATP-binding protein [Methanobrevibacter sp. DSM 116169]|uniref:ATP-binding protein n=1 Tax=Methanobrevibacter sp. DSM 116169 TaxID=3242727 RepID=UPI0038FC7831